MSHWAAPGSESSRSSILITHSATATAILPALRALALCLLILLFALTPLSAISSSTAPDTSISPRTELVITHIASTRAELDNAIRSVPVGGTAVIAIRANITFTGVPITIPANRNIAIVSEPHAQNTIRSLTQTSSNRHFIVNGNLSLADIIITSSATSGNAARGGIEVNAGGQLIMKQGSVIENSRRTLSTQSTGAVWVNNGNFILDGGIIRNNIASTSTAYRGGAGVMVTGNQGRLTINSGSINNNDIIQTGAPIAHGGAGVAVDQGASAFMNGGSIAKNTVTSRNTHTGGGGVLVGGTGSAATSTFIMNGGSITENLASYPTGDSFQPGEGGGIFVAPRGNVIMYGGEITENWARSSGRGGGGVYILGGRFTTANPQDTQGNTIEVTPKIIANNKARANGGGILVQLTDPDHNYTGSLGGTATLAEGTSVTHNRAGLTEDFLNGVGVGGGILAFSDATLNIEGAECVHNTSLRAGGGIGALSGSVVNMKDGKISHNRARADHGNAIDRGMGGGISVTSNAILNLQGGEIAHNTADFNGGGVRIVAAGAHLSGGTVSSNLANDGGGLFIAHSELSRLRIDPPVSFTKNTARNGIGLDHQTAANWALQVRPGTVSVNWEHSSIPHSPHAFTNFDINAVGPGLTLPLRISNSVSGDFAELNRAFLFEMNLYELMENSQGKNPLTGSIHCTIYDVDEGQSHESARDIILDLSPEGRLNFSLKHNEVIVFRDLPATACYVVSEEYDERYRVQWCETESGQVIIEGNQTPLLLLSAQPAITALNTWSCAPPSGLQINSSQELPIVVTALLLLTSLVLFSLKFKKPYR